MVCSMKRYEIIFERDVQKVYRRLPKDLIARLDRAILALANDPRPAGCKKLTGFDLYRIRVGDWRVTYAIEDDKLIVLVVEVAPRGGAYRNL
jgi:mRNA interferase RelE/StbE